MILWQTAKRWTYRGRHCEIQQTDVADETLYRGLVEVETGLSDGALDAAPVADPQRKHRPKRHEEDEHSEWVCFQWPGDELKSLREEVNGLADHIRDVQA